MPDKLTDSEIVKALECKIKFKCNECPYFHSFPCDKCHTMFKDALDLINRLQAEAENYKQIAEHQQSVTMDRGFEIKRLKEEYPFKCKVGNNSEIHSKSIEDYDHLISDIQAEAYKEFAERLKKETYILNHSGIDNLLKEMVGEGDG